MSAFRKVFRSRKDSASQSSSLPEHSLNYSEPLPRRPQSDTPNINYSRPLPSDLTAPRPRNPVNRSDSSVDIPSTVPTTEAEAWSPLEFCPDPSLHRDSHIPRTESPIQYHTVYYRVYSSEGAVRPKTCFDESDPSMGRIWVSPPCTVIAVKRTIAKEEHLDNSVNLQLYCDSDKAAPMDHSQILDFGSGVGPGSVDEPLGLNIVSRQPSVKATFRKLIKAKWDVHNSDISWLDLKKGQHLRTDGKIRFCGPNNDSVYMATNEAGQQGCVYLDDVY